jgi:hypothetical protein
VVHGGRGAVGFGKFIYFNQSGNLLPHKQRPRNAKLSRTELEFILKIDSASQMMADSYKCTAKTTRLYNTPENPNAATRLPEAGDFFERVKRRPASEFAGNGDAGIDLKEQEA